MRRVVLRAARDAGIDVEIADLDARRSRRGRRGVPHQCHPRHPAGGRARRSRRYAAPGEITARAARADRAEPASEAAARVAARAARRRRRWRRSAGVRPCVQQLAGRAARRSGAAGRRRDPARAAARGRRRASLQSAACSRHPRWLAADARAHRRGCAVKAGEYAILPARRRGPCCGCSKRRAWCSIRSRSSRAGPSATCAGRSSAQEPHLRQHAARPARCRGHGRRWARRDSAPRACSSRTPTSSARARPTSRSCGRRASGCGDELDGRLAGAGRGPAARRRPYEALILASIVEKETAQPPNGRGSRACSSTRLRIGMRLQTDPTVIYGLGAGVRRQPARADLQRDGPYNTYTRAGLPPTPIALPGAASLRAAVQPGRRGASCTSSPRACPTARTISRARSRSTRRR